jgi:hypothetical protein
MAMANIVLQQEKNEDLTNLVEIVNDIFSRSNPSMGRQELFSLIRTTAKLKKKLKNLDQEPEKRLSGSNYQYGAAHWRFSGIDATFAIDVTSGSCCYIVGSKPASPQQRH